MYLFNYIFYRVSGIYLKTGLETQRPDIFASGIVTLFQGFNIVAILYFFLFVNTTACLLIFIYVPLMLLNWIFFLNVRTLKKCQQKWDEEEKGKRQIKGVLIIVYMITSIIFFGLALSISV